MRDDHNAYLDEHGAPDHHNTDDRGPGDMHHSPDHPVRVGSAP
ncbi:hypothetical protein [Rhodococcus sp. NBC_00294]|nr:hypothetical protein [Rhodococcus sp. NBC_00294]